MPSASLGKWLTERKADLDVMESAYESVKESGEGPTRQIGHAYTLLLAAHFQGYCRDLHTECIKFFVPPGLSAEWSSLLHDSLGMRRQLDRGNPNLDNIADDFKLFGIDIRQAIRSGIPASEGLLGDLSNLLRRRNAIAHNNFSKVRASFGYQGGPGVEGVLRRARISP